MTPPVLDKSPAKSEQLFPYHLPLSPEWAEYNDWYSQTAMTSAAAGMFIKQPMYVPPPAGHADSQHRVGRIRPRCLRLRQPAAPPPGQGRHLPPPRPRVRPFFSAISQLTPRSMALAGIVGSVLPKTMLAPQTQSVPAA